MTTYHVHYELDEAGYWVATVADVAGCHTQGRSLETTQERIREALGVCVDDADEASLVKSFHIPRKPALQAARRATAARDRAERAQEEAQATMREAVRELLDADLSQRDAAVVLGISHQRVAQLAPQRKRA